EAQAHHAPPATGPVLSARAALAGLGANRSLEAERYLALFSQAERMRLALLTLSRLRTRIAREAAGTHDAGLVNRALEIAAEILASIAGSLAAGVKGASPHVHLAELRALSEQLRAPGRAPNLAAMRNDARWQIDALAGQLRVAADLAGRTTTAGLEEFRRYEA